MAKTYLNTVKYMIHIDFGISGIVEKPDIIGAIFGQSEGLLGEDMDLKELQKNGKVGRIEINAKSSLGKTKGEILVPSSMDTAQTSILAAAVELVDKVGPCDAKFNITNIEDVRGAKRDLIKGRAQELLQKMMKEQMPESEALADEIRGGVRKAKICAYGRDKIPAGPDIDDSEEIIVVEGRADVLNLLKNGIKNVIGMGGSQISPTVIQLSRRKKLTVFIDGDRGGELNARKLKQIASVAYIAHAPDGKEVEELAGKEILLALKRKVSIGDEKPARRDSNGGRGEGNGYGAGNYNDRRDSRPEYPGGNGERSGSREGSYSDRRPEYGSGNRDSRPSYGSDRRDSRPAYGSGERRDSRPSYGSDRRDSRPSYGSGERESRPSYGSDRRDSRPSYGSDRRDSRPSYGSGERLGYGSGSRDSRPGYGSGNRRDSRPSYGSRDRGSRGPPRRDSRGGFGGARRDYEPREAVKPEPKLTAEEAKSFAPAMKAVSGKLKARLFDKSMKKKAECDVKELVEKLGKAKGVHAVVFDGIITSRLAKKADEMDVKYLVGIKRGAVPELKNTKAFAFSA